jgi:hypothetical protein
MSIFIKVAAFLQDYRAKEYVSDFNNIHPSDHKRKRNWYWPKFFRGKSKGIDW